MLALAVHNSCTYLFSKAIHRFRLFLLFYIESDPPAPAFIGLNLQKWQFCVWVQENLQFNYVSSSITNTILTQCSKILFLRCPTWIWVFLICLGLVLLSGLLIAIVYGIVAATGEPEYVKLIKLIKLIKRIFLTFLFIFLIFIFLFFLFVLFMEFTTRKIKNRKELNRLMEFIYLLCGKISRCSNYPLRQLLVN